MAEVTARLAALPAETRRYALQTMPAHLAGAGQADRLRTLLTTYQFLLAKVAELGTSPLLRDYDLAVGDADLSVVQGAIRLSAHILDRDPNQLYSQLSGRLSGDESQAVVELLAQSPGREWLRPLTQGLLPAGLPLLRTLAAHGDYVEAVLAHPDGRTVISSSSDGSVVVWDVVAGTEVRRLIDRPRHGAAAGVSALALHPDGRRVLTGGRNGSIRIFDIRTGEEIGSLPDQDRDVGELVVLPDGRRVLCAMMSGEVRVLELGTGATIDAFRIGGGTLSTVVPLPDGGIVYGGGMGIGVWSVSDRSTHSLAGAEHVLALSMQALPDGRVVISSRDGYVRIFDPATARSTLELMVSDDAAVPGAAVLPDGRRLLTGTWDGRLELWDLVTHSRLRVIQADAGHIRCMAVLPEGRLAVTGGPSGELRVWDLLAERLHQREPGPPEHERLIYAIRVLPASRRAVSLAQDGTLKVWNTRGGDEELSFQLYDGLTDPTGWQLTVLGADRVVTGSQHGELASVRLARENAFLRWNGHALGITAIEALPDGRRVLSAALGGVIAVWDARTGRQEIAVDIASWGDQKRWRISALHALRDGRRALAVFSSGAIRLWDVETGSLLGAMPENVRLETFLLEENLVLGRVNGHWHFWDAGTGALHRTVPASAADVSRVYVAPRGGRAVSLLDTGLLATWRLDDGASIAGFGADAPLTACAISSDGRLIVAGDGSGRMHFLRAEDGDSPAHARGGTAGRTPWWMFWRR
jgi:WD40 repeat protein